MDNMEKARLGKKISDAESGQLGEVIVAFLDVMDSFQGKPHELVAASGMSLERATKIMAIASEWRT